MASFLDGIINGIFGPDTSEMTPEEAARTERGRAADQKDAYQLADSARKNPGASFMNGPDMSGNGDIIKTLVKMFAGGGG